jgi:transcriptional regulator with XRE-family HTH domain
MARTDLGRRIRTRRKELGWALHEAGRRCPMAVSHPSEIENGRARPGLLLATIGRGLQCPVKAAKLLR